MVHRDQTVYNVRNRPSEEQKSENLTVSVRIREQLKMSAWCCVQGQRDSFMSEDEEGGGG